MFVMIMGVRDHATKDGSGGRAHMLHRSQSIRSEFGHELALACKVIRQLDIVSTCKAEASAKCKTENGICHRSVRGSTMLGEGQD